MQHQTVDARPPRSSDARRVAASVALLAVIGGVAFDVGVRGGIANGVVAVALVASSFTLLFGGRTSNAQARGLAIAAIVPACSLAVRASRWLAWANASAALALLGCAICYSRSGSVLDTNLHALAHRARADLARAGRWPRLLRPLVPARQNAMLDGVRRASVGALFALPALAAVVVLLASADAVFARLIVPDVDVWPPSVTSSWLRCSPSCCSVPQQQRAAMPTRSCAPDGSARVEVVTMLGLAAVVLALFVASQLLALTD